MKTWVINSFGPGCQQPTPEYPVCSTSPPPQGQDALSPSHVVLSPQQGLAQPISEGQMLRCCQTLNSHLCKAVPLQLLSIRNHKWAWDAIKINIFDVESKDLCKDLDLCHFSFYCPPFSVTLRLSWTWSHGWIQNTLFPSFVGLPVLFSGPVIASLSIDMSGNWFHVVSLSPPAVLGMTRDKAIGQSLPRLTYTAYSIETVSKPPVFPASV